MNPLPTRWRILGACSLLGASLNTHAAGFALIEQGASGLGVSYAGAAAISNDTSTIWFNPAGMSNLGHRQLGIAGHVIASSTDWSDEGTSLNAAFGSGAVSGPDTASPGQTSVIPNLYYVAPINDRWTYGVGISVPYGSSTEYDNDWKGRYSSVESGIDVIDINPSVSFRLSDKVSLGAGLSVQRMSATLGNAVDSAAVCLGALGNVSPQTCIENGLSTAGDQSLDSYAEVTGDSVAVGFNVGAVFSLSAATRLGVAYRQGISHELDGDADFTANDTLRAVLDAAGAPLLIDGGGTADIDLPDTLQFSLTHQLNDKVQLLGDVLWTGWSSFDELRVVFENPAQPDSFSVQAWDDVLRFAAGINYRHNERMTLRGGVAFDEEPIPSPQRRTPRIPGNDRTWVSVGLGYALGSHSSFDLGFAHLMLDETPIDNFSPENAGAIAVRGVYDSSVNIVSAQFNWQFN